MVKPILDEYAVRVENKYTFFGVLDEHYDYLFRNCNDVTRGGYNRDYNRYILPDLAGRTMEECELEDYEAIIEKVINDGKKPSTVQRYRYLIRTVVRCAVENGICEDILFGSIYSLPPDEEKGKTKKKEFVRNRKSLRVKEEIRLFRELMLEPTQEGPRMGLALMFALGLRNGEACGLKFGAIRPMVSDPDNYCTWVYETTEGETSRLKTGGKTKNASRILPVPPKLLELLQKRKEFLQQEIEAGTILLSPEEGIFSIDDLPIACQKSDYTARCTSRHLTAAGRLLLKEIQISEDAVSYIDRELQNPENRIEMGVTEKDPTAYLLRRNLGTHLHILGFSESEIQYFMGHEMEDIYAERNEFTNEEHLHLMREKLQNRPLFNANYPCEELISISEDLPSIQRDNVHTARIQFVADKEAAAMLRITASEVQDPVKVQVKTTKKGKGKLTLVPSPQGELRRTVNVLQQYHRAYSAPKREE